VKVFVGLGDLFNVLSKKSSSPPNTRNDKGGGEAGGSTLNISGGKGIHPLFSGKGFSKHHPMAALPPGAFSFSALSADSAQEASWASTPPSHKSATCSAMTTGPFSPIVLRRLGRAHRPRIRPCLLH